jgi:molecular chaperone GrpE (heat shock protein)
MIKNVFGSTLAKELLLLSTARSSFSQRLVQRRAFMTMRQNYVNQQRMLVNSQRLSFATDDKKTEEKKGNAKEENKEEQKKEAKKATEESTSSSDEETPETLTKEDVKKIKQLIADQDKEIETLKEQVKSFKEKLIYQLAENDNTVKRYKKEIDSTREFAITKFAKDLLDVRDNLQMGFDFANKVKVEEVKDIEELKRHFEEIKKGMNMTQ